MDAMIVSCGFALCRGEAAGRTAACVPISKAAQPRRWRWWGRRGWRRQRRRRHHADQGGLPAAGEAGHYRRGDAADHHIEGEQLKATLPVCRPPPAFCGSCMLDARFAQPIPWQRPCRATPQGLLHEEDFNERIMAALRGMQPDRAVRALQYLSHAVSAEQLSGETVTHHLTVELSMYRG